MLDTKRRRKEVKGIDVTYEISARIREKDGKTMTDLPVIDIHGYRGMSEMPGCPVVGCWHDVKGSTTADAAAA